MALPRRAVPRTECGTQVLVDRLAADAELAGQRGLRFPSACSLAQLTCQVLAERLLPTAVPPARLGQGNALPLDHRSPFPQGCCATPPGLRGGLPQSTLAVGLHGLTLPTALLGVRRRDFEEAGQLHRRPDVHNYSLLLLRGTVHARRKSQPRFHSAFPQGCALLGMPN